MPVGEDVAAQIARVARVDVVEPPEELRRQRAPLGVCGDLAEGARGIFRKPIGRHLFTFHVERGERAGFGHDAGEHRLAGRAGAPPGGDALPDGRASIVRRSPVDRREDHDQGVDVGRSERDLNRPAIRIRSRGRDHVDRIGDRRFRREERAQAVARRVGKLRHLEPCRLAGIHGENAGAARVGDDRDAAAGGQRLRLQAGGDVEHLVDGVGADDARLLEEGVDGDVAGGERRRVAARRPRAGASAARFDGDDRLDPRDAPREPGKAARVPERFEIQQDHARGRVALPVLEQVVARHIGLVADADEGRQAHAPLPGELENRQSQRAALRREADTARAAA